MDITYDSAKNAKNIAERGLSFDLVSSFDFATANIAIDDRVDYGETRYQALGLIGDRLHVVVFMPMPNGVRVISLRKANKREVSRYEQKP